MIETILAAGGRAFGEQQVAAHLAKRSAMPAERSPAKKFRTEFRSPL